MSIAAFREAEGRSLRTHRSQEPARDEFARKERAANSSSGTPQSRKAPTRPAQQRSAPAPQRQSTGPVADSGREISHAQLARALGYQHGISGPVRGELVADYAIADVSGRGVRGVGAFTATPEQRAAIRAELGITSSSAGVGRVQVSQGSRPQILQARFNPGPALTPFQLRQDPISRYNRGLGVLTGRAQNIQSNPDANFLQRAAARTTIGATSFIPLPGAQSARDSINTARRNAGGFGRVGAGAAGLVFPESTGGALIDTGLAVGLPVVGKGLAVGGRAVARSVGDDVARAFSKGVDDFSGTRRSSKPDAPSGRAGKSRRFTPRRAAIGGVAAIGTGGLILASQDNGTAPQPMSRTSGSGPTSSGPGGNSGPGGSEGGSGTGFDDPFLGANDSGVGPGAASASGDGAGLAAMASSGIVALGLLFLLARD